MLAIRSINGVTLPIQPLENGFSVTRSDLVSGGSGRSAETGRAIRYPIRLGTYKLNLKFKGPVADIAQVYELTSRFTQTVIFYDGAQSVRADANGYVTAQMYPGDRQFTPLGELAELTVNLIEI